MNFVPDQAISLWQFSIANRVACVVLSSHGVKEFRIE
jgi:hypothetical protein